MVLLLFDEAVARCIQRTHFSWVHGCLIGLRLTRACPCQEVSGTSVAVSAASGSSTMAGNEYVVCTAPQWPACVRVCLRCHRCTCHRIPKSSATRQIAATGGGIWYLRLGLAAWLSVHCEVAGHHKPSGACRYMGLRCTGMNPRAEVEDELPGPSRGPQPWLWVRAS